MSNRRDNFALAAISLIALVGLSTEASKWYLVKRQAQDAADASALAGALALMNTSNVSQRVAAVAAANGFTDGSSPFSGTLQSVPPPVVSGNSVTVTISQTQATMLASLAGLKAVTVAATATATIEQSYDVCMLALNKSDGSAVKLGDNQSINGGGCSTMSDGGMQLASPPSLNGVTLAASNGCKGPSCAQIDPTMGSFSLPPAWNPLAKLDQPGAVPVSTGGARPNMCGSGCTTTLSQGAYSSLTISNNDTVVLNPGTYYFDTIKMTGGALIGNGVNIVTNSGLSIDGGTVTLTASTNSTPAILDGVLIYDRGTSAVSIAGDRSSTFTGALYFPNAHVTWGGNGTSARQCTEIVANTLTTTGIQSIDLNTWGCPNLGSNIVPKGQVVLLNQISRSEERKAQKRLLVQADGRKPAIV